MISPRACWCWWRHFQEPRCRDCALPVFSGSKALRAAWSSRLAPERSQRRERPLSSLSTRWPRSSKSCSTKLLPRCPEWWKWSTPAAGVVWGGEAVLGGVHAGQDDDSDRNSYHHYEDGTEWLRGPAPSWRRRSTWWPRRPRVVRRSYRALGTHLSRLTLAGDTPIIAQRRRSFARLIRRTTRGS